MVQSQEPVESSQSSCANCGKGISQSSRFCPHCGAISKPAGTPPASGPAPYSPSGTGPAGLPYVRVPNYLVQAILVTLFCCMPFGIVAVVYAARVNGKLAGGDDAGAQKASNYAKTWSWVSFGVGLGWFAIWILIMLTTLLLGA